MKEKERKKKKEKKRKEKKETLAQETRAKFKIRDFLKVPIYNFNLDFLKGPIHNFINCARVYLMLRAVVVSR